MYSSGLPNYTQLTPGIVCESLFFQSTRCLREPRGPMQMRITMMRLLPTPIQVFNLRTGKKRQRQFTGQSCSEHVISQYSIKQIQLNEYETVLYCLQLRQNLTWDCLLISVYLPVFTSFCMTSS